MQDEMKITIISLVLLFLGGALASSAADVVVGVDADTNTTALSVNTTDAAPTPNLRGTARIRLDVCDGLSYGACVAHPGCHTIQYGSGGFSCHSYGGYGGGPSYGGGPYGGGHFPCSTIYNKWDCDHHYSDHCSWHDGVHMCQND